MTDSGMNQRAQYGEPVGDCRLSRQQFTELNSWYAGGNRFVRSAKFTGSERFRVVRFQMAGTTVQPDDNQ